MKKLITLIVALCILAPIGVFAQSKSIKEIFEKYQDADDVKSISISMSGFRFNLGSSDEAEELESLFNQVDHVRILQFENHYKSFKKSDLGEELNSILKKNKYIQLVDIRSQDEKIGIYIIKQDDNVIKEGLIIVIEDDEAAIISVTGNIVPANFMNFHKHLGNFGHKHKSSKHKHYHGDDGDN